MKLSILVPSNRPEGLDRFKDSLAKNSVTDDVELVILVDDEREYIEFHHNEIVIHYPPKKPLNISELQNECYKHCTGDWIMLGNDDITCDTPEWDKMLFGALGQYGKDEISLFWPDDGMFGPRLSCFPIMSRKMLDMIGFFPQPYRRYKVDDTIYDILPNQRKYFLSNIKFRHYNDEGATGFQLENGGIYPIDREAAEFDNNVWIAEAGRRSGMRKIINDVLGISIPRVAVAVITQEMARRADFYDCFDSINNPPNVEIFKTKVHAQSPAKARNIVVEQAILKDCSHVLFLDDDVFPEPDVISKLLKHDKDIVTGLYLSRSYPHKPYIFDSWLNGGAIWRYLKPGDKGLIQVVAAGLGVCLVNMRVFHTMEKPWIRLGELEADNWCDDIGFFKRAGEAGFKTYCDLDCVAGHTISAIASPKCVDNKWYTSYWTASGEGEPIIPQIFPEPEPEKVEV